MSAATLLDRLERVKKTPNGWAARCPAHDDKGPSLSIRELDDGRVLVHCFAGCDVHQVIGAVGLNISDLFPPRETSHHYPRERRPFPAADVLRAIAFEALVVQLAAGSVRNGDPLSRTDYDRLGVAVARIQSALNLAGVRHG